MAIDRGAVHMNQRELHDEYYQKAVELLKEGKKDEAAEHAKKAIAAAKQMYGRVQKIMGTGYTKCQAEYLLEIIEGR